jgi:alanine dehydrogenase
MVVPYLFEIGENGIEKTLKENPSLARGIYVYKGQFVRKGVAERFAMPSKKLSSLL